LACFCAFLRVLYLPGPRVYHLRRVAGCRSRRRLSGGSQWTVTGPLLDFSWLLTRPSDYISLDHCCLRCLPRFGEGSCSQGLLPASRGRPGQRAGVSPTGHRRPRGDTTLSESGYPIRLFKVGKVILQLVYNWSLYQRSPRSLRAHACVYVIVSGCACVSCRHVSTNCVGGVCVQERCACVLVCRVRTRILSRYKAYSDWTRGADGGR
jgi:hypothetical protein